METKDIAKITAAIALIAAGVTGFYFIPTDQKILRIGVVVLGIVLGATVLWFSTQGREFVDYARDSIKETEKVVWPSKRETWQVTGVVFLFMFVLSLFMWIVDSGLTWLFYDVLLGRK
jgi:preprotein translocase subunit SecE